MFALKVLAPLLVLIAVLQGCTHQARQIDKLKAKVAEAEQLAKTNKERADGWALSLKACEANRSEEQAQALSSLNAAQSSCQARVDQTNRSRDNLSRLLANAPKKDAKGCAARDDLVLLKDLVR